jgi:hypothetical protein
MIAVTMAAGASRQIQTVAPSISSPITCGRAATDLLSTVQSDRRFFSSLDNNRHK